MSLSMLPFGLAGRLTHFFVATPFTLPDGEDCVGISGALIDSAVRRNDLATANGTDTAAGSSLLNVNAK
jgi:hypothetical protein